MGYVSSVARFRRTFVAALALACVTCGSASAVPGAKIGPVDCDAGGSVVTLSNDAGGPARFVLLRDDAVVTTVVVPAGGTPVRHVVPIAEGAAAQVTARYGGSYVSGYVRRGCTPQTAQAAAPVPASTSPTDAPFATTPVVPATGTRAVERPAIASTPTPDRVERGALPNVAASWPAVAFTAIAVLALTALARMLSRGHREVPAPTRKPRPTRTPS